MRRRPRFHIAAAALPALAVLAAAAGAAAVNTDLVGEARVVDAGTLDIAGRRIRLYGIDAPAPQQRCDSFDGRNWACGLRAAAQMHQLIGNRRVACVMRGGRDRDGDIVATCFDGAADLARLMVRDGYAIALPYVTEDYTADENAARAQGKGLWSGWFETPAGWRRTHAGAAAPAESGR